MTRVLLVVLLLAAQATFADGCDDRLHDHGASIAAIVAKGVERQVITLEQLKAFVAKGEWRNPFQVAKAQLHGPQFIRVFSELDAKLTPGDRTHALAALKALVARLSGVRAIEARAQAATKDILVPEFLFRFQSDKVSPLIDDYVPGWLDGRPVFVSQARDVENHEHLYVFDPMNSDPARRLYPRDENLYISDLPPGTPHAANPAKWTVRGEVIVDGFKPFYVENFGRATRESEPVVFKAKGRLYCAAKVSVRFGANKVVVFDVQAGKHVVDFYATSNLDLHLVYRDGNPYFLFPPFQDKRFERFSDGELSVGFVNALTGKDVSFRAESLRGNIERFKYQGEDIFVWVGNGKLTLMFASDARQWVTPVPVAFGNGVYVFEWQGSIYAFALDYAEFPVLFRLVREAKP